MHSERLLDNDDFVRALTQSLLFDGTGDDARQQAWVAVLRNPPRDLAKLPGFFLRCIERIRIDSARATIARAARERANAACEAVPSTAEIAAREEARRRVVAALLELDEAYRDVLVLRFYESLPPRTIATRLDLPIETVRTRIKRGLDRLRGRLESDFGNDPRRCVLALAPLAHVSLPLVVATGVTAVKFLVPAAAIALASTIWWLVSWDGPSPGNPDPIAETNSTVAPRIANDLAEAPAEQDVAHRDTVAGAIPQPVGPVTLQTRVVDLDGKPIRDAAVVVSDGDPAASRPGGPFDRPPGRTDEDGLVEFENLPERARYELYASAIGHSPMLERDARPFAMTTIVLDRARRLVGRVIDVEGRPVGGAKIEWKAQTGEVVLWTRTSSRSDGQFSIDDLPTRAARNDDRDGALGILRVDAQGFAPVTLEVKSPDDRDDLDVVVVVDRGARLVGRVVAAESGEPIAGAKLVFESLLGEPLVSRPLESPRVSPWVDSVFATTSSDSEGRFGFDAITADSFHEVPAHTYTQEGPLLGRVIASKNGRAIGSAEVRLPSLGSTTELRIELAQACEVRGRVVDSSGRPQANVLVSAQTSFAGPYTWHYDEITRHAEIARTDIDGRYTLKAVPCDSRPEERRIFAARPFAYAQAEVTVTVTQAEVAAAPDIVLDPDPSIVLDVVDREGRPITLARAADVDRSTVTRIADADGRIRLLVDPERATRAVSEIRVEAVGYVATSIGPLTASNDRDAVTRVVLDRATRQRGQVRFREGSPAPFARVVAVAGDAPATIAFLDRRERDALSESTPLPRPAILEETVCDSRGRFELRALPAAPVHIVAGARGEDPLRNSSRFATSRIENVVPPAEGLDLVLPLVPPREGNLTLEGTARDTATGSMLTEFTITLERDGRQFDAERIAPGRFRFRSLQPGEYTLRGRAIGHRNLEPVVVVLAADRPPEPLRLDFDRGVVVRGRVQATDGDPLDGALVTYRSDRGERCEIVRVENGRYELAGLTPGTWRAEIRFSIKHRNQRVYTTSRDTPLIVHETDRDLTHDIEAIVGGSILFEFEDARLPPILAAKEAATPEQLAFARQCELAIEDETGSVYARVRTIENGGSEWLDFPAGEFLVRFRAGDDPPIERRVRVSVGSFESITLP